MEPDRTASESTPLEHCSTRFPVALLAGLLIGEVLLLAWSANPAQTMRWRQPLASWSHLAAGLAVFFSLVWPMLRLGGVRAGRPMVQSLGVEAPLLALAAAAAAVPAIWWTDASADQVRSAALYLGGWLVAGGLAGGLDGPIGRAVRWAYLALMAVANLAFPGLAYLQSDLLNVPADGLLRYCPMARAADLGGQANVVDQAATAAPVVLIVLLLAVALVATRRDSSSAAK